MRPRRFRWIAALSMALALVASCTESDDAANDGDTSSTTTEAGGAADAEKVGLVQDLWLYHQISTIDASGTEVDLTGLVMDLLSDPAESVDIGETLTFHRHDDLDARLVDADDEIRSDVDVEVGVLDTADERILGVIATPTADAEDPIDADDRVQIDLTLLEDVLAPGDPLFVDVGYVQAWGDGGDEGGHSGAALLGDRAESGRLNIVGATDDDGIVQMTLSPELGSAISGSVWSDLPAKAHGMRDGFLKGFEGCKFGLKCVENYFSEMIDVAADFGTAFDCNLGVGRCDLVPTSTTTTSTTTSTTTTTTTTTTTPPPETPNTPTPSPPRQRAKVHGDPHMRTFDGRDYGMQAVGEFVAARNDDLEVQIRTAPWNDRTDVSLLTGVAVGVDGQALSVTAEGTFLDGEPLALTDASVEFGSARLSQRGTGFEVTTESGHTVTVTRVGAETFELWVDLSETTTSFEAMFGDNDGNPDNDFVTRDGTVLEDPDFDQFYDEFVDSWRISDDESLFHYADGDDTDTFTDRSFPSEAISLESLTDGERKRAAAVCRRAGIVDPTTLDQCTLDYALTGDIDFVRSALTVDTVIGVWEGRLLPDGSATDIGPDDGHGPDDDDLDDPADLGDVPTVTAEWSLTATQVREGDEFATRVICPEGGSAHSVWGTDTYSDDSSVCTAAVHIGLITFEDGGEVLISHVDGLGFYRGSTRHGVTTSEWDSWPGSFVFIGARGVPIEGEES